MSLCRKPASITWSHRVPCVLVCVAPVTVELTVVGRGARSGRGAGKDSAGLLWDHQGDDHGDDHAMSCGCVQRDQAQAEVNRLNALADEHRQLMWVHRGRRGAWLDG